MYIYVYIYMHLSSPAQGELSTRASSAPPSSAPDVAEVDGDEVTDEELAALEREVEGQLLEQVAGLGSKLESGKGEEQVGGVAHPALATLPAHAPAASAHPMATAKTAPPPSAPVAFEHPMATAKTAPPPSAPVASEHPMATAKTAPAPTAKTAPPPSFEHPMAKAKTAPPPCSTSSEHHPMAEAAPVPVPPPAAKASPPAPTVTGNLAHALLAGDGSLTPSMIYTPELEKQVSLQMEKWDDDELEKRVKNAPNHPEFQAYCTAVRMEIGEAADEPDPWVFGSQEPCEDVMGFEMWIQGKNNILKALGLAPPAPNPLNKKAAASDPIVPTPHTMFFNKGPQVSEPAPSPAVAPHASEPSPTASPVAVAKAPQASEPSPTASPVAVANAPQASEPSPAASPVAVANAPQASEPSPAASPVAVAKAPQASEPSPAASPNAASPIEPPGTASANAATPLPNELSKAVDDVTDKTTDLNKATSATNRKEYMKFLRQANNPSIMPKALIPTFTSGDKLDLFRIWLQKGQDFSAVEVEVNRRNSQKKTAMARDRCLSRADLLATGRYSERDVQELIERKTALGEWIPDPNFPQREDLRQYKVNTDVASEVAHSREDIQSINATTAVSGTEALTLTEDGADFSEGAAPTIHSALRMPQLSLGSTGGGAGDEPGKGKAKGKGRKGKGKGKNENGDGDGNTETKPDKVLSPMDKAKLLRKSVFL